MLTASTTQSIKTNYIWKCRGGGESTINAHADYFSKSDTSSSTHTHPIEVARREEYTTIDNVKTIPNHDEKVDIDEMKDSAQETIGRMFQHITALDDVDEDGDISSHTDDDIDDRSAISHEDLDIDNDASMKLNKKLVTKLSQVSRSILLRSEEKMSILETKQDEVLLDQDSARMPILEFGHEANQLMKDAWHRFDQNDVRCLALSDIDHGYIHEKRIDLITRRIVGDKESGVLRLFHNQLNSLREYYGRQFESILEEIEQHGDDSDMDRESRTRRRQKEETILKDVVKRITDAFSVAAQNAIPTLVNDEKVKDVIGPSKFSYNIALEGLLNDMIQATSSRQSMYNDLNDVSDTSDHDVSCDDNAGVGSETFHRKRVAWYEKVAARLVLLGFNYIQGWLAWQGIRKAAEERDRLMPKFPVF